MVPKVKVSKQQKEALNPIVKIATPLLTGNQEYVLGPPLLEEKRKIYESQVLTPLTISDETHAYMGPLPDPNVDAEKLKEFFPVYHRTKPLTSKQKSDNKGSKKT